MKRIDQLHLEYPLRGLADAARPARLRGVQVGRRHVATLMRRMGIEALYRRPARASRSPATRSIPICCAAWRSTAPEPGLGDRHHLHPDGARLRLSVWRSSTGPPAGFCRGGCRSRMDAAFCVEALEEALARHGRPEIFNTDQGSAVHRRGVHRRARRRTASPSAWTAQGHGGTTSSSNGCGARQIRGGGVL